MASFLRFFGVLVIIVGVGVAVATSKPVVAVVCFLAGVCFFIAGGNGDGRDDR